MRVQFRALTAADLEYAPGWWAGRTLYADRRTDEDTRSAVAVEAGQVVAAGTIWLSRVHDSRFWIDIVTHPLHRRRGIGTALVRHLATLRSRDMPFAARGHVGDEALLFADALGAQTTQIVPPSRVDVTMRSALRTHSEVRSFATIERPRLEGAYTRMYEWTHATWSPVRPGFETPLRESLWLGLDIGASAVALDPRGAVAALALTYIDDDRPLLVTETVTRDQPGGERMVEGCIHRCLSILAERGVAEVDFDGHVSDPHFLPALTRLEPTGRWFRIVEFPAP